MAARWALRYARRFRTGSPDYRITELPDRFLLTAWGAIGRYRLRPTKFDEACSFLAFVTRPYCRLRPVRQVRAVVGLGECQRYSGVASDGHCPGRASGVGIPHVAGSLRGCLSGEP